LIIAGSRAGHERRRHNPRAIIGSELENLIGYCNTDSHALILGRAIGNERKQLLILGVEQCLKSRVERNEGFMSRRIRGCVRRRAWHYPRQQHFIRRMAFDQSNSRHRIWLNGGRRDCGLGERSPVARRACAVRKAECDSTERPVRVSARTDRRSVMLAPDTITSSYIFSLGFGLFVPQSAIRPLPAFYSHNATNFSGIIRAHSMEIRPVSLLTWIRVPPPLTFGCHWRRHRACPCLPARLRFAVLITFGGPSRRLVDLNWLNLDTIPCGVRVFRSRPQAGAERI